MDIAKLQKEIHEDAIEKGWHDGKPLEFPEFIALCHTELSEALEAYRNNGKVNEISSKETPVFGVTVPHGIPIELADCIIRILDGCGLYGIDTEKAIMLKMQYNKTRDYRHGGKKL